MEEFPELPSALLSRVRGSSIPVCVGCLGKMLLIAPLGGSPPTSSYCLLPHVCSVDAWPMWISQFFCPVSDLSTSTVCWKLYKSPRPAHYTQACQQPVSHSGASRCRRHPSHSSLKACPSRQFASSSCIHTKGGARQRYPAPYQPLLSTFFRSSSWSTRHGLGYVAF